MFNLPGVHFSSEERDEGEELKMAPVRNLESTPDDVYFDVEEYVEEDIPDNLSSSSVAAASGSASSGGGLVGTRGSDEGEDGASQRDRRLLRVLFDGEAISSVYDHHALEPGVSSHRSNLNSLDARRAEAAEADAVRSLERSAPSYLGAAGNVARVSRAGPMSSGNSVNGNARVQIGRSSALNYPAVTTTNDPNARFGTVSSNATGTFGSVANMGPVSGAGTGGGSSAILARLRATTSVASACPTSSSAAKGSLPHDEAATAIVPDARSPRSNQPESLEEVIARRIRALFATATSSASYGHSSSRRSRRARARVGLSADFIISRFKDIGDHYAPIFRNVLRQVAVMNKEDNKWYVRE